MKYATEMVYDVMIYTLGFIMIDAGIEQLLVEILMKTQAARYSHKHIFNL
jgi:hypothetical protein